MVAWWWSSIRPRSGRSPTGRRSPIWITRRDLDLVRGIRVDNVVCICVSTTLLQAGASVGESHTRVRSWRAVASTARPRWRSSATSSIGSRDRAATGRWTHIASPVSRRAIGTGPRGTVRRGPRRPGWSSHRSSYRSSHRPSNWSSHRSSHRSSYRPSHRAPHRPPRRSAHWTPCRSSHRPSRRIGRAATFGSLRSRGVGSCSIRTRWAER